MNRKYRCATCTSCQMSFWGICDACAYEKEEENQRIREEMAFFADEDTAALKAKDQA